MILQSRLYVSFLDTGLATNMEVLSMIEFMAQRRNFQMNEKLRSQADVPASCKVLINKAGTAPWECGLKKKARFSHASARCSFRDEIYNE